jgi:DNA replication protein DnaC
VAIINESMQGMSFLVAYYLKNYLLLDSKIMINIVIEGPEESGKSHLMALIGKHLREQGLDVNIQSEHTHNAAVMEMNTAELVEHLTERKIIITGLRTFS